MLKYSLFIRYGLAALLMVAVTSQSFAQDDEDLEEKFQQGQQLVGEENFEEASELFREITTANEDFGPGWFFLGYSLHMNGDIDEALKAHKRAAGFEDFAGIATYNIGCAHALKHNPDDAITALQKAIENGFDQIDQIEFDSDLNSLHTDVRFAKILAELDDKEEVVSKLSEAEEFIGTGDFAKAAEIYSSILETDKRNVFATYRLGYALHGAGELDKALEMHTKATKFEGVAPVATYNIGCVHSLKDNKDEAMKALKKAVSLGMLRLEAYENDPDLENVRSDERFTKLISTIKEIREHGHAHGDGEHEHDDHDEDDDDDHEDDDDKNDDG